MKPQTLIKKYALCAINYVLENSSEELFNKIKQAIIFGSAARGTATRTSDIDIFFDCHKTSKKEIKKLINEYYTIREGLLYKTKGISNNFEIIADKLEKWEDLHKSIASEGIVAYGPYLGKAPKALKHHFIISWENLDIKNRGAFLNKVYGYTTKDKKYKGLIQKWDAKKIGKSAMLLPIKHKQEFLKILKKYEIDFKIIDAYTP